MLMDRISLQAVLLPAPCVNVPCNAVHEKSSRAASNQPGCGSSVRTGQRLSSSVGPGCGEIRSTMQYSVLKCFQDMSSVLCDCATSNPAVGSSHSAANCHFVKFACIPEATLTALACEPALYTLAGSFSSDRLFITASEAPWSGRSNNRGP